MELLERGALLLDLSRLLGEASDGHGRLVFLGGEAGIGKTSLVRRFGELVQHRAALLVGACDPLSTPRPLAPLLDIADRLPGRSLRIAEQKDELFRDVLAALAATRQPLVLVFEDVHWADEATLDLLRFLARRIDQRRVLLLATFRDDEVGDRHPLRGVLGDVATAPGVRRLTLSPLSLEGVRRLAERSRLDAQALFHHTGGNPFFVTEILASGGERIPATVRDAVLARAARLPAAARAVLDAAAVIGFRSEPWLLQSVAGADADATDACVASGMLTAVDGVYAFRHELAREAVLSTLTPHRRAELNRQVLRALRGDPRASFDAARLAHHAEEAGEGEAVLEYASEAARCAAALSAYREAAAQYARTLRFAHRLDAAERARLWEAYSWTCVATAQWSEATRAGSERAAIWRAEGNRLKEGETLTFLVGCFCIGGRMAEAEAASNASIALLSTLPPGPELAEAYGMQAYLRTLRHDTAEAADSAQRTIDVTEAAGGSAYTRVMGYSLLGTAAILGGDPDQERLLRRALDIAHEAEQGWLSAPAFYNVGAAWANVNELARAERCLSEGIAYVTKHELDGWVTNMLCWLGLVQLHLGRWPEAEESATRVARHVRADTISRIVALQALARLRVRRGDAAAAEVLDEALELALPTGTLRFFGPVRAARAEAAWLAGDPERVREEARAALPLALEKRHPWLAGELLCWIARAGEAVEVPAWIAPPFALQLAGRWAEAAAEWHRRGCPYEAAAALTEGGGEAELHSALAEFERLGARPAAQRTTQRLRELGARRIPRGPRPTTRTHPAGLTRREAEIVQLLAEGLRNQEIAARLFVSPKTVDHHVSRVLAKLDVSTRGAAVHEAVRRGLLQPREPDAPR
jgi:DNA-binding CsgD family transcriptional regulator/tetratricopeptide (TPR) repeat protein